MADLPKGMATLEVGPGLGTLTQELLKYGQTVHAVEFDGNLCQNLRERFASFISQGKLILTEKDAVKKPLGSIPLECPDYMVVANLPYAISSAWMEALLATRQIPRRMVLMLQKEAVERMWAKPNGKNFNALSVFLHASYTLEISHSVSRQCFHPVPKVDSVLIRMDRLKSPYLFSDESRHLIRRIFTQRRKQMGSLARREKPQYQSKLMDWLNQNQLPANFKSRANSSSSLAEIGTILEHLGGYARTTAFLVFFSASARARVIPSDFGLVSNNRYGNLGNLRRFAGFERGSGRSGS